MLLNLLSTILPVVAEVITVSYYDYLKLLHLIYVEEGKSV